MINLPQAKLKQIYQQYQNAPSEQDFHLVAKINNYFVVLQNAAKTHIFCKKVSCISKQHATTYERALRTRNLRILTQLITRVKKVYSAHSEPLTCDFADTNYIISNLNTLHKLEIPLVRIDILFVDWYKCIKPIHLSWKKKTIDKENKIKNKEILKCINK